MDATRSLFEVTLSEAAQQNLIQLFASYMAISDTIRKREKDEITADLLVKYETDRKEQENLLLKKEVGFQQLQLRSRMVQLIGLLFVVLILTGFGVVIYWLYRRKAQAYRIIVEQNIASVRNETRPEKGLGPLSAINPDNFGKMEAPERELLNRLLVYMEKEKPFLKTDLSLDELCKKINTNRTYLSNIINSVTGKNFHYFINQYRVSEARRILTGIKGDLYAVEEVGRMAGFGTKSSFYTCFKSVIGVTPAYYRDFVVATQNQ
jgi:YesN/AraC family two-component response regulator